MANIHDHDTLITTSNSPIFINLDCGYGQPSVTSIYLNKNDGSTSKIKHFENNINQFKLANLEQLKYQSIEIHTTIHDVRDNTEEKEDISLEINIHGESNNFVDTAFTKRTKGKGAIFHSFYRVTFF